MSNIQNKTTYSYIYYSIHIRYDYAHLAYEYWVKKTTYSYV